MTDNLKTLIVQAVENNVQFSGSVGTNYTVQELLNIVSLDSINKLYKKAKTELSGLDTDSLFSTSSNPKKKRALEFQVDTLKEVFSYKQDLEVAAARAEKLRKERSQTLVTLLNLKTEKEVAALGLLTLDQINEKIAALEL